VRAVDVRPHGLEAISFTLETDAGQAPVRLPIPGLYNVSNALAAAAIALGQGLAPAGVAAGLERFSAAFGRFERFTLNGRPAVLLLVKNPAGANEVIRTLAADPAAKSVLVALNDRIADGRDVSWVWDVDFEELTGQVSGAVVSGTRAAEMGVRLKYAGLSPAVIEVEPGLERALDLAAGCGDGPLYVLCTYTAMLELRGLLADRGAVDHHWQAA
jgi:UDP-N-acetylmuramyl tripeptide synthase